MQEKIIEIKKCRFCNINFEITDKDLEFYDKVSPVFSGKKYNILTPTLCPDCRQQRRFCFRNERKLYKRKCDATGKDLITMYSPDKKYIVYDCNYWWSDKWSPFDYGMDFDFSRSFFEQFDELIRKVPRPSLLTTGNENSPYTNYCSYLKDCYLLFDSSNCEQFHYGHNVGKAKNGLDSNVISECENIYECIDCFKCYNLFFSQNCNDCRDSYFLNNCIGCINCIGCCNLINKQFFVENKFVGEEKFKEILKNTKENIFKFKEYYFNKIKNYPKKYAFLIQTEEVYGNSMISSKNCYSCYDGIYFEDSKYCSNGADMKDTYDCESVGIGSSLSYEINASMRADNMLFSFGSWGSKIMYCETCTGTNLFGCIGIRDNAKYCILNKQYKKEEYEKLVPRVIEHMMKTGEWGEFFPSSMSPFGYNETVAMEYYPIPHPDPLLRGEGGRFKWSDYEPPFPKVEKIISASKLPDSIADIPDDILNWAIECEVTKKPFRIISQELEFYRKHNLPIPRRHPDQRHLDRMALRNPRKLFDRKCDKCGKDMKTTYNPDRKEIIYCEECYNKEIY